MRRWLTWRITVLVLSGLYALIFALMLLIHPGSDRFYTDFNNSYQILAPLFAAVCGISYAWKGAHSSRTSRIAWLLIGLAALSFAIGQSTWTFYETVLRLEELPSPGPADIGYLGAYPLLVVGVILLFGTMRTVGRARLVLDSFLATSSVAILSWFFLVSRLWAASDTSLVGKLISVGYPLGDVAALLCAVVLLNSPATNRSLRRSTAFLASGIVLLAFADTAFTYYNLNDAYQTGSWFDWGWSYGWLLMGYALLLPLWWPASEASSYASTPPHAAGRPRFGLGRVLAPYVAVVLAFGLVVRYDISSDGTIHVSVLLIGLALILLVMLRQVLTLLENQHLTAQLRTFNVDLETIVVNRTEQLSTLLQLTKAVNTTLVPDQVIAAALNTTRHALQGDAVIMRLIEGSDDTALPQIVGQIGLDTYPDLVKVIEQLPTADQAEILTLPTEATSGHPVVVGNYLRTPLLWEQRPVGMIGVIRWNAGFGGTEPEMLESIGVEVGTALEHARLYGALRMANDTLTANNQALQEAREAALDASRLKSEFLATMSHEIRTPMNGVLGMTELVLATPLTAAQREYMGIIRDSGQALLTIIDDILDFSKIEAGQMVLDPTDLPPVQLIEAVAEVVVAKASTKQIDLLTYVAPEVPTMVYGDAGRLRQVLLNLVGNAVKFTHYGEVSVRVTLEAETPTGVTLRFAVYDTGIGLSAPAREHLFQPFTQADGSMARRYGGTGLGLAISKRLVELMGGMIGVESVEGQGSTFWFTVPLQRVVAAAAPTGSLTLAGRRVLVVDGSTTNRAIVQSYLEARHLRSDAAATGAAGLASVREAAAAADPYDLVLLDVTLPDLTPAEFGRRLGDESDLVETRVLLMRAFETQLLEDETSFTNCVGSITKPVRQAQLWAAILSALDRVPASLAAPAEVPINELLPPPVPAISGDLETRILVAEDNPVNQKLTLLQLAKLGYWARAVANGREAIVALGTEPYDLVLMDCQMPEMDGFQATATIRNAEASGSRHVPIIALTANAMPSDRAACLAAGMDDYLTKPLKLDELRARLAHWLPARNAALPVLSLALPEADIRPAPLDVTVLNELRALQTLDMPDILSELIDLFTADASGLITAMRHAIASADAPALRRAAHTLKGSSANLGASLLATRCKELEACAQAGRLDEADRDLTAVTVEYARAAEALRRERTLAPA